MWLRKCLLCNGTLFSYWVSVLPEMWQKFTWRRIHSYGHRWSLLSRLLWKCKLGLAESVFYRLESKFSNFEHEKLKSYFSPWKNAVSVMKSSRRVFWGQLAKRTTQNVSSASTVREVVWFLLLFWKLLLKVIHNSKSAAWTEYHLHKTLTTDHSVFLAIMSKFRCRT